MPECRGKADPRGQRFVIRKDSCRIADAVHTGNQGLERVWIEARHSAVLLRFGREQVIANAKIEREPTPGPPVVLDVETGFLCAVPRLVERCAAAHNRRRAVQQIS